MAEPALNEIKIYITKGEKAQLKVLGTSDKISWSVSNSKIASVNTSGVVTGKKYGTTTVTAKAGKKKLKCKVIVRNPKVAERLCAVMLKNSKQIEQDYKDGQPWHYGTSKYKTFKKSREYYRNVTCLYEIFFGLREIKVFNNSDHFCIQGKNKIHFKGKGKQHLLKHGEIIPCKDTLLSTLIRTEKLMKGDICLYYDGGDHHNVYAGDNRFFDTGRVGVNGYFEDPARTKYCFTTAGPVELPFDLKVAYIIRLNY